MSNQILGGDQSTRKMTPRGSNDVQGRETYRLLNLTDSDTDDSFAKLEAGGDTGQNRGGGDIPDLNLPIPLDQKAKGRRKIRLKRRQHDSRRGASSTSGHDDAVSGDLDWYLLPATCSLKSVLVSSGVVSVIVAIVAIIFFGSQVSARVSELAIELENVAGQRNELEDKYNSLRVQVQGILVNQTQMRTNQTRLEEEIRVMTSQIEALNTSLETVSRSLATAPELKTLPSDVSEIKTEVAKFGSRIAELESEVKAKEVKMRSTDEELRKLKSLASPSAASSLELDSPVAVKLKSDLDALDERLTTIGTSIGAQLKEEQKRSQKSWTMLGQLESSIQTLNESVEKVSSQCCAAETESTDTKNDDAGQ